MKTTTTSPVFENLPLVFLGAVNGAIGIAGLAQPSPAARVIGLCNLAVGAFGVTKALYQQHFLSPTPRR